MYFGLFAASAVAGPFTVDPSLFRERLHPGPGGTDYITAVFFIPLWFSHYALAGLDIGQLHWTDKVPLIVQVLCLLGVAAALGVLSWAVAVNRFFSSVIRIQRDRGHEVITTGPYRYVRHPGYAAWIFLALCSGPALGSWAAAIPMVLTILPVIRRSAREDRILREQLEGYVGYAQKVRYRLLPGVW